MGLHTKFDPPPLRRGLTNRRRRIARAAAVALVAMAAALGCGDSARSSEKQLRTFAFLPADNPGLAAEVPATIDGTAIAATVPAGTNVGALVAAFSTTGARVTVGGAAQTSGTTANDFTTPVTYRVVAADGTTADYTVTIAVGTSTAKDLTALAFRSALNAPLPADVIATINGTAVTAVAPFGTNLAALVATFSTTGASVTVGGTAQTSGATANDFTSPVTYRVTAADGSTRDYVVTVTRAENPAKDLTALAFLSPHNAVLPTDVTATIGGAAVTAVVPFGTRVSALVATFATTGASVTVGGAVQFSDATPNDFTSPVVYRVTAADGSTKDYTVTVTVADAAAKDLTAWSFRSDVNIALPADVIATINGTAVTATVPFGTNLSFLVATFSTTGQRVTVGGATQTSGLTPHNFTSPVIYRVVAADSSTRDYTVTIAVAPSPLKDLTALSFRAAQNAGLAVDVTATISGTAIAAVVPFRTAVTALVATFSTTGASVTVGGTPQTSGATPNNFTDPVRYHVVAADGSTKDYTVTVTVAAPNQQAYIKASNPDVLDVFGTTTALSADGSTLAVGAYRESSSARGIGGNQTNNNASESGAVYVFTRSGATWVQQAYLKASNADAFDRFGISVALSADGSTLAVGAYLESSAATGVNGDQTDNSIDTAGAVYVFTRSGTTWSQQAYVKASSAGGFEFGTSVALSADGTTLAVGAPTEPSAATGINGDQTDTSAAGAGAVYVFTRSGTTWSQEAYVKASAADVVVNNMATDNEFGTSVALSADGSTLAVGAYLEDSAARGINGDQASNAATSAGAVYVFTRSGTTWSQQAYVKASNTGVQDYFGTSVALSGDGSTLAVGAYRESSAATGIDGNQANRTAQTIGAGAVYVFTRSGVTWSQQAYVKASNTGYNDTFGTSVSLSSDGSALAVGAKGEASAATGTGGNQADNSATGAGAVYLFTRGGQAWRQRAYVKASNTFGLCGFGVSVAVSGDGSTVAVGADGEPSAASGIDGDQADRTKTYSGAVYVFH